MRPWKSSPIIFPLLDSFLCEAKKKVFKFRIIIFTLTNSFLICFFLLSKNVQISSCIHDLLFAAKNCCEVTVRCFKNQISIVSTEQDQKPPIKSLDSTMELFFFLILKFMFYIPNMRIAQLCMYACMNNF